uniref:Uncharacterized protein n=3 Tax=Lotharella globosa TaxID=91324 RepID=A0A7S4DJP8_9EUKA|mmetsp:Transcript_35822/g.69228  ORF Transcript_35822/g.69228 Transcript_35822/m.69228 type:complete len:573 (+) Transcript_35822:259-1977(+)|eukprot:CAMPEP_0167793528 /NCGR_PEP_ID=MMETSP0111_2-20121227/13246_1 /TAXON_ID=91324 /ORGANISM="Lotharella globosa, Strain CCCM811" /LENGTH=572 /DNA_ID=CAMNT_0007686727 /DNA_START=180 /DNA_END=1898 /DNA_ORIENTATION=-
MISIGATALTLFDKARKVSGLATHIKTWVRDMLPTQRKDVRILLERLCCRVDAMSRPMHYCWLWASDKDSCISDIVFHCRRALFSVDTFITELANAKQNSQLSKDPDKVVVALRDHLNELDFCVQSLSLALQIITSSHNGAPSIRPPTPSSHTSSISPSCLLQASQRVLEMFDTGGDVVTAGGTLYQRKPDATRWSKMLRSAVWKIHHDLKSHSYSIVVNDISPAPSGEESTTPNSAHAHSSSASKTRPGKGAGAMTFALEPSLGFRRLAVDELEVICNLCTKPETPSSEKGFVDVKAYGMPEAKPKEEGQAAGFLWDYKVANNVQHHLAFIITTPPPLTRSPILSGTPPNVPSPTGATPPSLHLPEPRLGANGGGGEKAAGGAGLTVTTLLYIARLCMYENFDSSIQQDNGLGRREPRHRQATDEELTLLLSGQQIPREPDTEDIGRVSRGGSSDNKSKGKISPSNTAFSASLQFRGVGSGSGGDHGESQHRDRVGDRDGKGVHSFQLEEARRSAVKGTFGSPPCVVDTDKDDRGNDDTGASAARAKSTKASSTDAAPDFLSECFAQGEST